MSVPVPGKALEEWVGLLPMSLLFLPTSGGLMGPWASITVR